MINQTNAIADILVLENMSPPFVAGVLGEWGSGKTFAMSLIEQRLGQIMNHNLTTAEFKNELKKYPYCGRIYIVHFNAWTFCKDELWASLMYRILHYLNEQLDLEAHIRNFSEDLCMRGIDYVELRETLRSDDIKKALYKYIDEAQIENPDDFSFIPRKRRKGQQSFDRYIE